MNTYEGYLERAGQDALKMEDALRIYTAMCDCVAQCTLEDKMDFWNDFLKKAAKYTGVRCEWEWMSREEKLAEDAGRSRIHNGVIDALNILARIAEKEGVDSSWREQLGDARKRIGDFACFVTYMTGIANR